MVEVRPKGNSITQAYYTERLLPVCFKEIKAQKALGRRAILQEDNDPSYGTLSAVNYARRFKEKHQIETLTHPGQFPDLNPIEGTWNILI